MKLEAHAQGKHAQRTGETGLLVVRVESVVVKKQQSGERSIPVERRALPQAARFAETGNSQGGACKVR